MIKNILCLAVLVCPLRPALVTAQFQQVLDIEQVPFEYSRTTPHNRVSQLLERLSTGTQRLDDRSTAHPLAAWLEALQIPESSQVLVFSKTSLQVKHISSRNPRAVYFNDDTYLGWVHGSQLVELATADPRLGTAFYTLELANARPKIQQAFYDCLGCHSTSLTQGIPGLTVRSVQPTWDGVVDPQLKSFVTDDRSPLSQRWGGWYVTGQHGDQSHLGNAMLRNGRLATEGNDNRSDLRAAFDTSRYLNPYSDIVALMVLEHQTQTHNALVRADFFARQWTHERVQLLASPTASPTASKVDAEGQERLRQIAQPVVERLLFRDAVVLTSPLVGSNSYAAEFAQLGPFDARGRSLRQFNLRTRLFEYPCSYLIYTPAFANLQPELREEIYAQLQRILSATAEQLPDDYPQLDLALRRQILEILQSTVTDWPRDL